MTHPHHNIDTGASQSAAMPHAAWFEFCWISEGRQEYWRRFGDYLFTDPPREIPRELLSPPFSRRQRKPAFARLAAKAKQLGMEVTIEPNGAVTFRCSSVAPDAGINEWDEVLPRHGTH